MDICCEESFYCGRVIIVLLFDKDVRVFYGLLSIFLTFVIFSESYWAFFFDIDISSDARISK